MRIAPFDQIVVVDWSASSVPKRGRDSIWIGTCEVGITRCETRNVPTRSEAFEYLEQLLSSSTAAGRRTLVGLDFSLAYPAGFSRIVARTRPAVRGIPPWRQTWDLLDDLVHDGPDNTNNRFVVADQLNRLTSTRLFWGRPNTTRFAGLRWLPTTNVVPEGLGPNPCAALRLTERLAGGGIRSNFQLFGGVTVGGQVLTGIPWLARLKGPSDRPVVWPLETGFVADPLGVGARHRGGVVFAELWPSLFGAPDPPSSRPRRRSGADRVACLFRTRRLWGGRRGSTPSRSERCLDADAARCWTKKGRILGVARGSDRSGSSPGSP